MLSNAIAVGAVSLISPKSNFDLPEGGTSKGAINSPPFAVVAVAQRSDKKRDGTRAILSKLNVIYIKVRRLFREEMGDIALDLLCFRDFRPH